MDTMVRNLFLQPLCKEQFESLGGGIGGDVRGGNQCRRGDDQDMARPALDHAFQIQMSQMRDSMTMKLNHAKFPVQFVSIKLAVAARACIIDEYVDDQIAFLSEGEDLSRRTGIAQIRRNDMSLNPELCMNILRQFLQSLRSARSQNQMRAG